MSQFSALWGDAIARPVTARKSSRGVNSKTALEACPSCLSVCLFPSISLISQPSALGSLGPALAPLLTYIAIANGHTVIIGGMDG